MTREVTVCIPVYNAEAFVRNAIESVLAQSVQNFTLLISVDPSGDNSAEVSRAYEGDPRVTVVENADRLGWVGNVNTCLDRIKTPLFAFCFHDDTLEPRFLEHLVAALERAPSAVAAFGAMQRTGDQDTLVRPGDVAGTPGFRAKDVLKGNFPAYNIKNLMRSGPVLEGLRLPQIGEDGFRADLSFALSYALAGDFVAVPDVVYRKTHRSGSVTADWGEFDTWRFLQNLLMLRANLIEVVGASRLGIEEKRELVELIVQFRNVPWIASVEDLRVAADSLDLLMAAPLVAGLFDTEGKAADRSLDPGKDRVDLAESRLSLARRFRSLGDSNAARHYAEQALRFDPASLEAHCLLARIWLTGGLAGGGDAAARAAQDHAEAAIALNDADPIAWLLLARAQAARNNWSGATENAENALARGLPEPWRAENLIARGKMRPWRRWVSRRLSP